jgi:hypothetical protein
MRLLILITATALATGACNRSVADAAAPATTVATAPVGHGDATATPSTSPAHEITIPAGTVLPVVLDTGVSSTASYPEEAVHAHMTKPIVLHGVTVVPTGSRVAGVVTDATRSGRVKGRAHVAMRFESLTPAGVDRRYTIHTTAVGRTAASTHRKDALEIGAPAAGGALIGALVGGKKGALIGGAAGGGAGTAVVLSTRGKEVSLPKGSVLTLRLTEPVTVAVKD